LPGNTRLPPLRAALALIAATIAAACAGTNAPSPPPAFLGFTADATAEQQRIEQRFKDAVSSQSISDLHRPLAQRPHPAGSEATAALVAHLESTLRGFGLDVKVHEYRAHLSRPRSVRITQTAPVARDIRVDEPAIAADPTSSHAELGGGYIAYSASGSASGELVDVEYGLPADYEALKARGVSVSGKIALARYGRSHRAVKVHTAQEAGARALILYSNPADDGPAKGAAWPEGYWRGGDMLQRGNAKLSWFWHGDPLTPGVAATPDAARLSPADAPTLPRIPVAVISANQAAALRSTGNSRVRVQVDMADGLRPIYNVVASLRGRDQPDRRVMLGTHHDAWTFGAVDPGTGMAALLEVAKGVGLLAKDGWRPSRTIDFAFWDAEEFGLIGSTEYAEEFRSRLQEQLIVYVNTDMYMQGRFDAGGVPSLRDFVTEVVGEHSIPWKSLGSGADFVAFQDHLGIPSLSVEYIGANGYGFGTYHSNYDSRAYVEKVADPGFAQGVQMAQVLGTLALRISNAAILPFRFADYTERLRQAVAETGSWSHDAKMPIDIDSWLTRVKQIETDAVALEAAIDRQLAGGASGSFAALNDRLARLEQQLADDAGAADSQWYRHVFYGWNIYSLYDGQLFPGLAEALRVRDAARVEHEIARIDRAFDRMHAELTAALADVR
jgi:N-acetylated-alpha-linked acidic dipeptidase